MILPSCVRDGREAPWPRRLLEIFHTDQWRTRYQFFFARDSDGFLENFDILGLLTEKPFQAPDAFLKRAGTLYSSTRKTIHSALWRVR